MSAANGVDRLRFGLLGPLQVVHDGTQQPFPRGSIRTLLATLLLYDGEPVSSAGLIDATWGDKLPRHPTAALSTALTRLRQRLGAITRGAPDLVVGVPGGYMLTAAEATDAAEFLDLLQRSEAAIAVGDLAVAEEATIGALALWRGSVLPEVDSPRLRYGPIARLEERLLQCAERRVVLAMLRGHEFDVIGDLYVQVQNHPTRERLWYYLALALHRDGRSVEALEALRRADAYLREEVGVDSGPDLRDLYIGVTRQDPALLCPPPDLRNWLPGCFWTRDAQPSVAV